MLNWRIRREGVMKEKSSRELLFFKKGARVNLG